MTVSAIGAAAQQAAQQPHEEAVVEVLLRDYRTGQAIVRSRSDGVTPRRETLQNGHRIVLCLTASKTGYVQLFSVIEDSSEVFQLYPNEISHPGAGDGRHVVQAGEEHCVGVDGTFELQMIGEPGSANQVYVEWSDDAAQLSDLGDSVLMNGPAVEAHRSQAARATLNLRVAQD